MNYKILFIFITLLCMGSLAAADLPSISSVSSNVNSELEGLDTLINATRQNLDNQQAVKKQIESYQKLQKLYLQNPDNKDVLFQIVKNAFKLQEAIRNYHLEQAFTTEFLNELSIFAQVANKHAIPKP